MTTGKCVATAVDFSVLAPSRVRSGDSNMKELLHVSLKSSHIFYVKISRQPTSNLSEKGRNKMEREEV